GHGDEITRLTRRADDDTTLQGRARRIEVGVENEARPLPEPVEMLVGQVTKVKNPRSGKDMTAMVEDRYTAVKMKDFGTFVATRSVLAPRAYLFRAEPGTRVIIEKLLEQGVAVEELTAPFKAEVEAFEVDKVRRSERVFQGHKEVRLTGRFRPET